MRLAHLNQDPGVGPAKKKGASVHVECMRRAFARCGAEVLALDLPGREAAREALERLHAERPLELIYERYALEADAGAAFARERGVPLVLEVNAPLLLEAAAHRRRPVAREDEARERTVFAAAELLLCVSHGVAEYTLRHGVDPARVIVRPNGVDVEVFRPRPSTDALRRELALDGCFVLGFHGRLRAWHGFENVVLAARRLIGRGLNVHVLAIGEGDFARALEPLGARHATHLPWLPHADVARYVACFDALALGYRAEDACYFSPLKLFEALACGAVAVAPAAGDLAELLQHEHDALLYPPGDVEALARELERLASDDSLRLRLVRRGSALAARHSWDSIAREVLGAIAGERAR